MPVLEVRNFAQIDRARIEFGDLTVLVGPQGSGKSLLLTWLKVALDIGEIVRALDESGQDVRSDKSLLDLVFGEGMERAWRDDTDVRFDGRQVRPRAWTRGLKTKAAGKVFFIPAHRALLLSEGWPAPFLRLTAETPVVARLFSQNLYERFSSRRAETLFPAARVLKAQYRALLDDAIFHGGQVALSREGLRYRLRLVYDGDVRLPFMTWSAGQREFTPLLLGLYHVLTPRMQTKRPDVDWVVIEEPEMGLHPRGIVAFLLLVLDLLARGYKVALSTHSPLVLDAVWAIRHVSASGARWQQLCDAFGVGHSNMERVMNRALSRSDRYRTYFLDLDPSTNKAVAHDISNLDPDAADANEAEWGGLTGFSSRFGEAVRRAANAGGRGE